eukprot:8425636-Alexandrium_andersonii.AAC.1
MTLAPEWQVQSAPLPVGTLSKGRMQCCLTCSWRRLAESTDHTSASAHTLPRKVPEFREGACM